MDTRTVALARSLVVVACLLAPTQTGDDEALKKDLTAVMAFHGLPCGQVLNAAGRVSVEKRA